MTRRLLSRFTIPAVGLLISAVAAGEPPPESTAAPAAPIPAPAAPPQDGAPAANPAAKKAIPARSRRATARRKGKRGEVYEGPLATLPGFRMLDDDQSRVTVEVNQKVDVSERKAQGRVTYHLRGVRVPVRVARLPLQTGFFNKTPVGRIELVEAGDGADLVIETREQTNPTFRVVETPQGIVVQIDFPKATQEFAGPIIAKPRAEQDRTKRKRGTRTQKIEAEDDGWDDTGDNRSE